MFPIQLSATIGSNNHGIILEANVDAIKKPMVEAMEVMIVELKKATLGRLNRVDFRFPLLPDCS